MKILHGNIANPLLVHLALVLGLPSIAGCKNENDHMTPAKATQQSAAQPPANCSSDTALKILRDLVRQEAFAKVEKELQSRLLEASPQYFDLRLSGITTLGKTEGGKLACEATLAAVPLAALTEEKRKFAHIGSNSLEETVRYAVTISDDRQTIRVEATGFEGLASLLHRAGHGIYYGEAEIAARQESALTMQRNAERLQKPTNISSNQQGEKALMPCESDLNECGNRWTEADKKLNDTYQAVMASLSKGEKSILQNRQISWIKFRDQQCSREQITADAGASIGVSMMTRAIYDCQTKLTINRTSEIAAMNKQ